MTPTALQVLIRIRKRVAAMRPPPASPPKPLFEPTPDWFSLRPGHVGLTVGREQFYHHVDRDDVEEAYESGTFFAGVADAMAWVTQSGITARLAFVIESSEDDQSVWIAVIDFAAEADYVAYKLKFG